jgi:hypothetical protein
MWSRCASPKTIKWSTHSRRIDPIKRKSRPQADRRISPAEFDEVATELGRTLDFFKVPQREKGEGVKFWQPLPPTRTRSRLVRGGRQAPLKHYWVS